MGEISHQDYSKGCYNVLGQCNKGLQCKSTVQLMTKDYCFCSFDLKKFSLDMVDLENKVRTAIIEGQPLCHRPWKKILIIVEGVYRYVFFRKIFFFVILHVLFLSSINFSFSVA